MPGPDADRRPQDTLLQHVLRWLGLMSTADPAVSRPRSTLAKRPPPRKPEDARPRTVEPWSGVRAASTLNGGLLRAGLLRSLFEELDRKPSPPDRQLLTNLVRMLGEEKLSLPVFPDVALRLDRMLRGPEPSVLQVAALVRRDPDLVRRVWGAAHNVHFARGATSLDNAIARIGYDALWRVVMSACMHAPVFRVGRYQPRIERLRQHGLVAAEVAAWLSENNRSDAYLAALLHKAGVLMILRCLPAGPLPDTALLERIVRHHHPSIGVLMAQAWDLGGGVAAGIGFHPNPGAAPIDRRLPALIVHVASIASHTAEEAMAGVDCGGLGALEGVPDLLFDPHAAIRRASTAWQGLSAGPSHPGGPGRGTQASARSASRSSA